MAMRRRRGAASSGERREAGREKKRENAESRGRVLSTSRRAVVEGGVEVEERARESLDGERE